MALAFARLARTVSVEQDARKSLDAFNQEFIAACQRMDHKADAAFWTEDGVDLLPGLAHAPVEMHHFSNLCLCPHFH